MAPSRRFLQPVNFVNIESDPVSASSGDFYYNSASSTLRYFDGTEWKNVGEGAAGVTVSETAPEDPVEGQGWFKSSTSELYFWDGSFWVEATSMVDNYLLFTVSASAPSDPMEGAGWFDNAEGNFYIWDGTYWQQVTSVVQSIYGFTIGETAPESPVEGAGWFNNVEGEFYIYDGTYWQEVVRTVLVDLSQDTSPELSANLDANDYGIENVEYIDFNTSASVASAEGRLTWNSGDQTLNIGLANGVVLQAGQESHVYAKNETGSSIANGKVVFIVGSGETIPNHPGHPLISEFIADGSINAADVLGVTTQDIDDDEHGYVTAFGMVRDIDTSLYPAGTILYASSASAGYLTDLQPTSPDLTVIIGAVVESSSANGSIFINPRIYPTADLVTYDNSNSLLLSSNVKGALDELSLGKADINSLAANLVLYPTSASSTVTGYYRMVESTTDDDYDDTAIDVSTGNLNGTGSDHLIASLVADAELFTGNPGSINITTVGNIRKTSGNANAYSEFFFKMYKRDSGGTETLLGTSSTTGAVNPTILNNYEQFYASGNFLIAEFNETDRVVIKYYSNILNDGSQSYEFQFGGSQPVRTLIPLPVSVLQVSSAEGIIVDTSNFNNNLSGSDTTVQSALDTLDDLDVIPSQTGNSGKYLTTDGTNASWDDVDALTLEGNSASYFTGYADSVAASALSDANDYTDTAIANLVDSAPPLLDTLNELAAALGDDENFASTTASALSSKAPLDSPSLTGTPTAPTAASGTSTTQIATTEFVQDAINSFEALPDQTGNDGKYLTTDGSTTSWSEVDSLPDQTGNEGKYLTTDGSTASWGTVEQGTTIQTDVALSNSWWMGV